MTTIAVAWALAAWLPQQGWERSQVVGRLFEFEKHDYCILVDAFIPNGAARRQWNREQLGAVA
ncbi:MAG: hypothetical protein ACREJO_02840 [Phycisphaerales bacterium]